MRMWVLGKRDRYATLHVHNSQTGNIEASSDTSVSQAVRTNPTHHIILKHAAISQTQ